MGLSGISVLLASGDNGVGCNSDGSSQEFDYPSSPYITMVGATYLDSATKTEIGATLSSGRLGLLLHVCTIVVDKVMWVC